MWEWLRKLARAKRAGGELENPVARRVSSGGKKWRVLRQKLRIEHIDPVNRAIEIELTLQNVSAEDLRDMPLDLGRYRPGLSVTDAAGVELPYLPTSEVVTRLKKSGDDAADRRRASTILWVLLAQDVGPGETVVLNLTLEDPSSEPDSGSAFPPSAQSLLPTGVRDWLIRKPTYSVFDHTLRGHESTLIVEIRGPAETTIEPTWASGVANTPDDEVDPVSGRPSWIKRPRFVFARLPAGSPVAQMEYHLAPLRGETQLLAGIFLALLYAPLFVLIFRIAPPWTQSLGYMTFGSPSGDFCRDFGILGMTATLAIIAFIRPVWVNRAAFIWPLLTSAALLVFAR